MAELVSTPFNRMKVLLVHKIYRIFKFFIELCNSKEMRKILIMEVCIIYMRF
jgi:hypothetical protein